nr:reverse transcriptase domain-containing protein [Tanacetum cinerariifolium]
MVRDTIQLEDAISTISQEYLLEFTFEYGIPESLHLELSGPEECIIEFLKVKVSVYIRFFEFANFHMDLFSLISTPNPAKVKTETRPHATHKVSLLTATANRVIDMEDMASQRGHRRGRGKCITQGVEEGSCRLPSCTGYPLRRIFSSCRIRYGLDRLHDCHPRRSSFERAGVEISTGNVATTEVWGLFSSGSPKLGKSSSIPSIGGLPEDIYQSGWGVTNNCRLDTPEACQDMVDHIVPSRVAKAESNDLRNQTKNLKIVLEAEVDMKKAVSDLQAQVTGEEKMKAAFEEFKRYEDDKVEQRCAEMDARLDKLSVDFNEELYPHMLTAIARGLAKGMSKGLKHGIKHGRAGRDLADIEAYDPLERLKDAPIDVIMASLYLESDSGEAAPQWIRELRPSSSQLNIPVYTEVRGLKDPWRERAAICEAKAKSKVTMYYNARVKGVTFRPGDFLYRSNDASHAVDGGKLGPKCEGPYEVTEALGDGAYKLASIDGTVLSKT